MQLTVASYNIRKAIGMDRRRDPARILAVLRELDADVVVLQEADRRWGLRKSALPVAGLNASGWQIAPVAQRRHSIGWHGNALLVRRGIDVRSAKRITLPVLEPRGAIMAQLAVGGQQCVVAGVHLDLSGLRRRVQIRAVLRAMGAYPSAMPKIIMGDFNQWSLRGGAMQEFGPRWRILAPGPSFPSSRPFARLDRIALTRQWHLGNADVHTSALATQASDHLPITARLNLPNN